MIRRLRLFSGLVMLAYVTMHLLNHAVGLISLEAMENVLWYIFRIWTNRPAQLLALLQLPRPLRAGGLRAVAAADIAVERIRAGPGGAGLRHPIPARPPRSHDGGSPTAFSTPMSAITLICCGSISSDRPNTASCRCWFWSSPGVMR